MRQEVRQIPIAPRQVRCGPLLAHRWPLGLLGGLLAAVGGLWAWMLFLAAGGKPSDQWRLDHEPVVRAEATVTQVEPPPRAGDATLVWPDGIARDLVHYTFPYAGHEQLGRSYAARGQHQVGQSVAVELLPAEPNRNRIPGTLLHHPRPWLSAERWLGAVVVPGGLLLLGWLAGVFQLRHVLIHGDVSVARVRSLQAVRWVLPAMWLVRYEFRDHGAVLRRGAHWVRVRSELGQRLAARSAAAAPVELPVLHDRRIPQWNRLLLASQFRAEAPRTEGP